MDNEYESGRGVSPSKSVRSKYEFESFASLMGMNKKASSMPVSMRNQQTNKTLKQEDIETALKNINSASKLASNVNTYEKAMELYQKSIGVLIRASSDVPSDVTFDKRALKELAKAALTEAEELKNKMNKGRRGILRSNSSRSVLSRRPNSLSQNLRSASLSKIQSGGVQWNNEKNPLVKAVKEEIWIQNSSKISWDDIAGLDRAKRCLQEAVILPILRPDLYTGLRSAPKGILLYGPPGTGKTMLAKAAASESETQFFSCSTSSLTSKWHGESEKILKVLFTLAAEVSPSIIFFDEIDAILSTRKSDEHEASRRFKTEFMIRVDGVVKEKSGKLLVLGCTNCPWDLDEAVLRRFQRRIYVPLPDPQARKVLIQNLLCKNKNNLTNKQVDKLVELTEGYSCSDLKSIGEEAAFGPLRSVGGLDAIRGIRNANDLRPISFSDFYDAIENNSPSVSAAMIQKYQEWEKE